MVEGGVAIVGSGPAALAAAWRLIDRGVRPVMLDAGETLPAEIAVLVEELRHTHGHWNPETLETVTQNATMTVQGLPKKLVFGSDFIHGTDRVHSPLVNESFVAPTFALGGYTVAWGGAMLPIRQVDMAGWPIGETDLAEGFAQVLRRIPWSGAEDDLSADFPCYGGAPQPLRMSAQADDVRQRLTRLQRPGAFVSGRSRLAVQARECRYCGMCLTGCPFGVIQTFDRFVHELSAQALIEYRPGVIVTRLANVAGGVTVQAVDKQGTPLPVQRFHKVFLAAGAIGSTRIALESMGLYGTDVPMLDSQKFAVPLVVPMAEHGALDSMNTLPSLFVDARLPSTAAHWTHLQVSSFSHYALQAMKRRLALGPLQMHRLLGPLTKRFMVGWGGLHSDYSDGFVLTLLRAHERGRPLLKIRSRTNVATRHTVTRAMWQLSRQMLPAGIWVATPGAIIGPPGAGFHFGGSLAMRSAPSQPTETDVLGRLNTLKHVHVVDASVLPSIPSTTLVLTIMANAWRIAGAADV